MGWLILVLLHLVCSWQDCASFVTPIKNPDGSIDFDSLLNHVDLLEQTVSTLQHDSRKQKTEIANLKGKVSLLQSQLGTGHVSAQVTAIKDELFITKLELHSLSSEVGTVNASLKKMASGYKGLQVQLNGTNKGVHHLRESVKSDIKMLNSSLQEQINATKAVVSEFGNHIMAFHSLQKMLDVVNTTLSGDFTSFKQTTNNAVKSLQRQTVDVEAKVNSTQTILKDKERLLDNIARSVNTTTRDTSLLKTDITLVNQRVVDMQKNLQRTSNTISTNLHTMNNTIQSQLVVTSALAQRNMNSLHSLQANLAAVNSTLSHSAVVKKTEMDSLTVSVKDQKLALESALARFNVTEKKASLLKTDVSLINSKVLAMTKTLQTTNQSTSRLAPIVDRLNVEVSFEAWNPIHSSFYKDLKFSDIKYNVGGGYNTSSGMFFAPVAGVYLFWANVEKKSGSSIGVYLVHNILYFGYAFSPDDGSVTVTGTAAAELAVGDAVYVKTTATALYSGVFSSFGGVLLRKH